MTGEGKAAVSLGQLKQVDLKSTWKHEALEFTPWLAAHLNLLSEVLDRDLQLVATEHPVGPFRADLLCRTGSEGTLVVVENQFGKTDHSHLGQLLTYVAGTEAVTVVWIAERFTDEHRAALDWLNAHTPVGVDFFGLELQLWQIDNSPLAPKFNIVSQPNAWTKGAAPTGLSDTAQLQLAYWTAFREYVLEHSTTLRPTKPLAQNWYEFFIGRDGFWLGARINTRQNSLRAALFLAPPATRVMFQQLEQDKVEIEAALGVPLLWRASPGNKRSSIELHPTGANIRQQDDWPQQHKWLLENLEGLQQVFVPRVQALKLAEPLE